MAGLEGTCRAEGLAGSAGGGVRARSGRTAGAGDRAAGAEAAYAAPSLEGLQGELAARQAALAARKADLEARERRLQELDGGTAAEQEMPPMQRQMDMGVWCRSGRVRRPHGFVLMDAKRLGEAPLHPA